MRHYYFKSLLTVLLAFCVIGICQAKNNEKEEANAKIGDIYYFIDKEAKTAKVAYKTNWDYPGSGNTDYVGDIVVPASVVYEDETYPVTAVGKDAFCGCGKMTSITLPNTITEIGRTAFEGCINLKSVTFPESVVKIGSDVFRKCTRLEYVEMPDSAEIPMAGQMFLGCTALKTVRLPQKMTSISAEMFKGCTNLESIDIPSSVTSIGMEAYYGCTNLASVKMPEQLTTIGRLAFQDCQSLKSVKFTAIKEIGDGAFSGCSNITELDLGSAVEFIDHSAFANCKGLTKLVFPKTLKTLRNTAFKDCCSLVSISVDANNETFSSPNNCNAVLSKDGKALYLGCKNTRIPSTVISISYNAFYGCEGLTNLSIPSGVTYIYSDAFNGCVNLKTLQIPSKLQRIFDRTFYNCRSLTQITIPNTVTRIDDYAFANCESITKVNLPKGVTTIGRYAFSGCSSVTSMTVESGNTVYDSRDNCNAIIQTADNTVLFACKNTKLPSTVTAISSSAFYNQTGLTTIYIPESVVSIEYPFEGCNNLSSIIVDAKNPVYDSRDNCNALVQTETNTLLKGCKNTIIPSTVTKIGSSAFRYCMGLTTIVIPESVTYIDHYAFEGCTGLTSIAIPESVTSIGICAFEDCSNLQSISIPKSVENIEGYAFSNCSSLTSITLPAALSSLSSGIFFGCTALKEIHSHITMLDPYMNVLSTICDDETYQKVPLYVPVGMVDLYKESPTWNKFAIILEEGSTGFAEQPVTTNDVALPYYDLNGRRFDKRPTRKGIYIRRGQKIAM